MSFIWLASYPRSGNTLLRRIIHTHTGWATYSIYPDAYPKDRAGIGHIGLDNLNRFCRDWSPETPAPHPMFCKTHEYPTVHGPKHPAVLLVRDGRDVAVSYAHYLSQYSGMNFEKKLNQIIQGAPTPRSSWSTHTRLWLSTHPLLIIKFEDMVDQIQSGSHIPLTNLFSSLGIPIKEIDRSTHMRTFNELNKEDPGFYRSGTIGQWQKVFTQEQTEKFWEVHGKIMSTLGYRR